MITIAGNATTELKLLNADLQEYVRLSKKDPLEAIQKHSQEFTFRLFKELQQLKPGKGTLRAQGLALLATGRGVQVRGSVRAKIYAKYQAASSLSTRRIVLSKGKRGERFVQHSISAGRFMGPVKKGLVVNLQAQAVKAELTLRERGKGFLSISARFPAHGLDYSDEAYSNSIFGQRLGAKYLTPDPSGATARFVWGEEGPQSLKAATGLSKTRAQGVILATLKATRENLLEYVRRKQKERAEKVGRR